MTRNGPVPVASHTGKGMGEYPVSPPNLTNKETKMLPATPLKLSGLLKVTRMVSGKTKSLDSFLGQAP